MVKSGKPSHIISSGISIADTGVGARHHRPMSLEPELKTKGMYWRPGRVPGAMLFCPLRAGWRTLTLHLEMTSNLSCGGRGTGLDHGEGEFSHGGAREHGAGLVALFSLALSISVVLRGVPASHRTGFKTASKMGLFLGSIVSFRLIHFYLFDRRLTDWADDLVAGIAPSVFRRFWPRAHKFCGFYRVGRCTRCDVKTIPNFLVYEMAKSGKPVAYCL